MKHSIGATLLACVVLVGAAPACGDDSAGGSAPGGAEADVELTDCRSPFGATVQAAGKITSREDQTGDFHIIVSYDNGETGAYRALGLTPGESESFTTAGVGDMSSYGGGCELQEVTFVPADGS